MSKKKNRSVRARRVQQLAQQKRQRRLYYGAAAVGMLLIIGLFALIRQFNAPSIEDIVLPDSLELPANADGKAWGPVDAPILVEEYSDFQ
jgi:hypothetical protein